MSLCRHFVRELRRSVLVETPDLEKTAGKRESVLGSLNVNDPAGPSMHLTPDEKSEDERLSAFLRNDNGNGAANGHSPNGSFQSQNRHSHERMPRPSLMTNSPDTGAESASPLPHTVARGDIRASAEKILYVYLLQNAEREIRIPHQIVDEITHAIEVTGRDDPEVFDAAKDYVFQAMERDAFPGFLRTKALGNLVPPSIMLRLMIGLLAMFGGFWGAFALIFLDEPRHTRAWLILPFAIGSYALASYQYQLDPIMAFIGFSEYTFMSFSRIREPYVHKLLTKRSLIVLGVTILTATIFTVIFVFVPGKRL
ncbi:MAG: Bud site selection protein, Revert to axial protein 1 [Trizodia sp. TS-e1964]|nr:MAG: Bud site selection protein, Revert to axial protein 1 [Trizodia sp. TS-e1964]